MTNRIDHCAWLRPICLLPALIALSAAAGCWAPQNIGRYNELAFGDTKRVRNKIFQTHDDWYAKDLRYWIQGEVEEPEDFPGPTPADLKPPEGDYILGPGDVVSIIIEDLFRQGQPFVRDVRVSEVGNVSLPYLNEVKAGGFTPRGLEQRLIEMLKPPSGPLRDPRVSVFVRESRNRIYSIISGVRTPGVFEMVSSEMDLLQAVGRSNGVTPFVEEYGYLVRRLSREELADILVQAWAEEAEAARKAAEEAKQAEEAEGEAPQEEQPAETSQPRALTPLEELQALAAGEMPKVTPPSESAPAVEPAVPPERPAAEPKPEDVTGGWKFEDGQWVRVVPTAPEGPPAEEPEAAEPSEVPTTIEQLPPLIRKRLRDLGVVQGGEGLRRIIRISVPALLAFDPTQNVVLRNGDVVNFPEPAAGEWYIDGEVVRRGVYTLTGRKITLLQAVAAAGGLTQLAIPWRTELVRRVGDDAEEIIYVDLAKIARGEAPDFYLQPNDLIRVGTDQGAIFLAVLRNAFRATYGFGLVYDQNFADIYPFKGEIHPLF